MMLEENFLSVYDKFKVEFFRRLFSLVREREGSLSAMEAFSVEIIKELDSPTISQFADFLGISQSNATYKVNSLIKKGYIVKENSDIDRREYHLKLSEKYYHYSGAHEKLRRHGHGPHAGALHGGGAGDVLRNARRHERGAHAGKQSVTQNGSLQMQAPILILALHRAIRSEMMIVVRRIRNCETWM